MGKYVVILVVALWATHLLLSRRASRNTTAAEKSVHRAVGSTLRKAAIAVCGLIAVLVMIVLVKHVTA